MKAQEFIKEGPGDDEKIVAMIQNLKHALYNHDRMSEHPSLHVLDQLEDDLRSGEMESKQNEGADFLGYFKKDERTWSFPDGMETKTPHRSNHAARTILQALGLPMDFEHEGPIPLDQFIKATRNYMEKNDDQKDTDMYQNVYMYDQEALRMKANHKEITHVAFA